MDNKKKTLMIVLGIFALVIVTTAASFAFFTYSRTGNTKATIISGDIEFSYIEGDSAELVNAFPIKDEVGAIDESGEYDFQVKLNSSGTTRANYNVYFVDNNTSTNHFTNEQIKFALIKNDVFVANTSATEGVKLSTLDGFNEGSSNGEGLVLEDQEITSGETDNYKLRIWISDDVNYSNTPGNGGNDNQTSIGKYNSYKYSLKVKITSEVVVSQGLKISNVAATGRTISAKITDDSGLNAYAITRDEIVPTDDSDEWTEITNETAKSNVVRTATDLVISKTIDYNTTDGYGVYYIHAKNNSGDTVSKSVNVEFKGSYGIAAETIMNLALTNASELRIDEHEPTGQQTFPTKEYRYWGATSYNYVQFNNELWRIIGVFDVDDGTGNVEKRLKIIRAEEIGNYSWDSSTSSVNFGHGVNEWSQADIMKLLNSGAYYNRGSGICYLESNNKNTTCDFTQNGLTTEAKEMIGNAKWYLGSHPTISVTTPEIYAHERGTFSGKQCTSGTFCDDKIERTTSWAGKIGLMYPSDYGYAADMTKCSSASLSNYKAYCGVTSWLKSFDGWMISPYGEKYSVSANRAFFVSSGKLGNNDISYASRIYPVTYLKSDIKIIGGLGTDTQPFILSK